MRIRFVYTMASRYLKAKRRNRTAASSFFSVAGIAVGVMTLVVVLAVMNGFQLSFIEPIMEVKSYHIQAESEGGEQKSGTLEALRQSAGIRSAVPFVEVQAIAAGKHATVVRGISLDASEIDRGFTGSFDPAFDFPGRKQIERNGTVVIGRELARQLFLAVGDVLPLFTFAGSSFIDLSPGGKELLITGIFKTGYYEIDRSWAFTSLETAGGLGSGEVPVYGIKLHDPNGDLAALADLRGTLEAHGLRAESWRDFNRTFFGALLTEKIMMMILIGLIFVVVGFNIFHGLRRAVFERTEEIATVKALGARASLVRNIFVTEGFLIGFLGSLIGLMLGLFLALNVNPLFRIIEDSVNNAVLPALEHLLGSARLNRISLFSPDVFYIDRIPVRILLPEVFIIVLFALSCSSVAAYAASKRVSEIEPSAIMRYV
jgi:lipoprotein-releasing system permease protein